MDCDKMPVDFSKEDNPSRISLVPLCSYRGFHLGQGWYNTLLTTNIAVLKNILVPVFVDKLEHVAQSYM